MKILIQPDFNVVKLLAFFSLLCITFYSNAQSTDLVIITGSFESKVSLKASLPINVLTIEVSNSEQLLSGIKEALEDYPHLKNLHLFSQTGTQSIQLGNDQLDVNQLNTNNTLFQDIAANADSIDFFVYSCSLANNGGGKNFLEALSNRTGFNVLSAANCNSNDEQVYVFDYSTNGTIVPTTSIFK